MKLYEKARQNPLTIFRNLNILQEIFTLFYSTTVSISLDAFKKNKSANFILYLCVTKNIKKVDVPSIQFTIRIWTRNEQNRILILQFNLC